MQTRLLMAEQKRFMQLQERYGPLLVGTWHLERIGERQRFFEQLAEDAEFRKKHFIPIYLYIICGIDRVAREKGGQPSGRPALFPPLRWCIVYSFATNFLEKSADSPPPWLEPVFHFQEQKSLSEKDSERQIISQKGFWEILYCDTCTHYITV